MQARYAVRFALGVLALCVALLLVASVLGALGVVVMVALVAALLGCGWLAGDRLALRAMRAYPVSEAQQPAMYRIVRELSVVTRRPVPRLYVSPTAAPNAFATGRNPRHAAICCTEGLLARLDERELRGVLAHELAHAHRRDLLSSTIAVTLAAAVLLIVQLAWVVGAVVSGNADDDEGGGPLGVLLLAVLGPVAAAVLRPAVTRSREHHADSAAAAMTGDPLGLAGALRALDRGTRDAPLRPEPGLRPVAALMTVDPFRPGRTCRMFATHPPTADRVARLEALAGYRR